MRITKIEEASYEDVYDIRILNESSYDNQNFVISPGLVVHNSAVHVVPWKCFHGDTLVRTKEGSKRIKDLSKEGAFEVLSYKEGKLYYRRATAFLTQVSTCVKVSVAVQRASTPVICTLDHLFRLADGAWVQAIDLRPNDKLCTPDPNDGPRWVNNVELVDSNHAVYDVSVYDERDFRYQNFVIDPGIVVHNCELMDLRKSRYEKGARIHYDFSQMEVRTLAKMSGDKALTEAFLAGKDIHKFVASHVWSKPEEEVTDAERRYAKMSCIHGDSKIKLLEGKSVPIKELEGKKDFWVYSCDPETETVVPGKVIACEKTKRVNSLIEVEFDDGGKVKMDPDHRILCRDGIYRKVKNLEVGDSIMPFNSYISTLKTHSIKGYEVIQDPSGTECFTHKRVTDTVNPETRFPAMVRHHRDFNKRNNVPNNIELMTWYDHHKLHHKEHSAQMKKLWELGKYDREASSKRLEDYRNSLSEEEYKRVYIIPFTNWNDERRLAQSERMKEESKDWYNSRQYRGLYSKIVSQVRDLLEHNLLDEYDKYRPYTLFPRWEKLPELLRCNHDDIVQTAWHAPYSGIKPIIMDTTRSSELGKAQMKYLWESDDEEAKVFRAEHAVRQSNLMTRLNYEEGFQDKAQIGKIASYLKRVLKLGEEISVDNYRELSYKVDSPYRISLSNVLSKFDTLQEAVEFSKTYNHYIVSIKEIKEETDLYDMIVEGHHNYVIETSENSGIVSSNSFSIIYGKSVRAFAQEFMKGDYAGANKLFTDFFTAFPGVLEFIKSKHREALESGLVTTMFGDTLVVDMPEYALTLSEEIKEIIIEDLFSNRYRLSEDQRTDRTMRMQVAKALRNSQNYPLQSSASSIAGYSIYRVYESLRDSGVPIRPEVFTHDSGDFDSQLKYVPQVIEAIPREAVDYTRKRFDIPVDVDIEIGLTGTSMISLEDVDVEGSYVLAEFKGRREAVEQFQNYIESHGVKSDFKVEKDYEEMISMKELFITRRAYSLDIGKKLAMQKGKVEMDFSALN